MRILALLLFLPFGVNALPNDCYIFSVGEPVLRGDTMYYPVRRVCYDRHGGYRVQQSDYTVDEINAENYEPAPMPPPPSDP